MSKTKTVIPKEFGKLKKYLLKEVTYMQHTIFGLAALYTAVATYIVGAVLWIIKEVKEAADLGLLSDWHYE